VVEIDSAGQASREIVVPGHVIVSLQSTFGTSPVHCGISQLNPSQYSVVAFNEESKVQWEYSLPVGAYHSSLPPLQRVDVGDHKNGCLVAGPDGSVHFLSGKGELIDRFDYGEPINDFAATATDEGLLLWVTAGSRLTAWRIQGESAP
jgi:hypothetical protein